VSKPTNVIRILPTGAANIASVRAAFERLELPVVVGAEPDEAADAKAVVLPGVGTFGAAMEQLTESGLADPLRERIESGRPTLCICLGMQLLLKRSQESPGVDGLGVIDGEVGQFSTDVISPHFGWNVVRPGPSGWTEDGYAYFANSYRVISPAPGWEFARTDYDGGFISMLRKDNVLACQFHPELSGPWGERLLLQWSRGAGFNREEEAC
jgi:imidazole glycerol phosphate synthase glutamine amidotransferase subunit